MPMDGRCRDLFNGFSMVSLSLLLLNLFMNGRTAARRKKTRGARVGACTRISGNGINYLSVIAGLLRILFPFTRFPLDIFFLDEGALNWSLDKVFSVSFLAGKRGPFGV